jgi:3'-phosphoadenosine 5'-phosphosulfate sulfotransferase (PAPS reductase)/FAD synthetase
VRHHNIISVSGGKDSTALLLLAIERQPDNLQAVFADTGHEHQQTYDYVQYLNDKVFPIRTIKADFSDRFKTKRKWVETKWREQGIPEEKVQRALAVLYPTGIPFLDLCVVSGRFPSTKAAFCSQELKRNPIIEQVQMPLLDQGDKIWSWQGVRADESLSRRNLVELEEVGGGLWNYRPILKWTAEDAFAMHRKHGVKHNPLYEQGMGRVGCMPCINTRKDELLEISRRFPEEIKRVSKWEKLVQEASKKGSATLFAGANRGENLSPEQCVEVANIYSMVEWSKTSRGGTQYDFLRVQNDGPVCSSIYGLCE